MSCKGLGVFFKDKVLAESRVLADWVREGNLEKPLQWGYDWQAGGPVTDAIGDVVDGRQASSREALEASLPRCPRRDPCVKLPLFLCKVSSGRGTQPLTAKNHGSALMTPGVWGVDA